MTYAEALSFWFGRVNYEVRSARPGDLKLERMRALLRLLGDPHDRVRLVHVTGTKGKGSTCAMLASVLQAAGYRVGLFTSPHLVHVVERIQVDGKPITHGELAARMEEVAVAVRQLERDGPPITFFEIGTALGFLQFCYLRCDIAVIEVGLGGRFDSTNVCNPLVSVITNVGLDHTAQLGQTLEEIAFQKAGIIKRGVPVVSGVTQEAPRSVIHRTATAMNAPLWETAEYRHEAEHRKIALRGDHQVANAAVALATLARLRAAGMSIAQDAVATGLAGLCWPARVEVIAERPAIVLDTAHNVPSIEALVRTLAETFPSAKRRRVVFAVSSDKEYAEMLRALAEYFTHFHLTRYGHNPRCVPPEKLAAVLEAVAPGTEYTIHHTSAEAWALARSRCGPDELICVTGSVFLAGELLEALTDHRSSEPAVRKSAAPAGNVPGID
jgi:dihydrofolate synthase / folylpolyglutamate synthase